MRLIRLLLALACVAFGVAFAALNGDPVAVDLLWVEFRPPLGLLLLAVLLLGALLGGLAAVLSRWTTSPTKPDDDRAGDDESTP